MASVASVARKRADWRRVEQLYDQFVRIVTDPEQENTPQPSLTGALAESLGRVLAHYDGRETQFIEDLLSIWCDIESLSGTREELFRRLYRDERLERYAAYNPPGDERRRPKPFEAAVETCRRLTDANAVRIALSNLPTGGILGGSVSYGRFFNTCGATVGRPSDTDLLLVLPEYTILDKFAVALRDVPDIEPASIAQLRQRIRFFGSLRKELKRCIISHKLKLWERTPDPRLTRYQIPSHYFLSLHFFSIEDFSFMILQDRSTLEVPEGRQFSRYVVDYRDTQPTRNDNQRSFSGIDMSLPLQSREVNGGHLSRVAVAHIVDGRFYPGLHQNLILPQFEIRWQDRATPLYLALLSFRWKILERLTEERRQRPFELQTLSLSHTRSAVFAPHITRRADRD